MSYLKNHKLLLLVIGVLLAANIGLIWLYVFNKPEPPRRESWENIRTKFINEIGLTGEQVKIYDSLRNQHYESIGPRFKELRETRDSLFKLIHQSSVNDSFISSLSAAVFEKQQAIDLKIHRYFQSLKNLCTDEQKPKLDSFLNNMANRKPWGSHRGPGPEKKENK
jgi:hypothetical protein